MPFDTDTESASTDASETQSPSSEHPSISSPTDVRNHDDPDSRLSDASGTQLVFTGQSGDSSRHQSTQGTGAGRLDSMLSRFEAWRDRLTPAQVQNIAALGVMECTAMAASIFLRPDQSVLPGFWDSARPVTTNLIASFALPSLLSVADSLLGDPNQLLAEVALRREGHAGSFAGREFASPPCRRSCGVCGQSELRCLEGRGVRTARCWFRMVGW